jgi:hypothetical protein
MECGIRIAEWSLSPCPQRVSANRNDSRPAPFALTHLPFYRLAICAGVMETRTTPAVAGRDREGAARPHPLPRPRCRHQTLGAAFLGWGSRPSTST